MMDCGFNDWPSWAGAGSSLVAGRWSLGLGQLGQLDMATSTPWCDV
jgi:hypothetical protein